MGRGKLDQLFGLRGARRVLSEYQTHAGSEVLVLDDLRVERVPILGNHDGGVLADVDLLGLADLDHFGHVLCVPLVILLPVTVPDEWGLPAWQCRVARRRLRTPTSPLCWSSHPPRTRSCLRRGTRRCRPCPGRTSHKCPRRPAQRRKRCPGRRSLRCPGCHGVRVRHDDLVTLGLSFALALVHPPHARLETSR